jgi:flotillin
MERGQQGIIDDVKLTLMGSVRSVVANLTPEQVQSDKESFKKAVEEAVTDELKEMGLELVSLNIQDVSDNNDYYANMAAVDSEAKRLEAEKIKAITSQQIREQTAESDKLATQKELDKELAIEERKRDNNLKKAEFKAEVDKANKDAEAAGEIQQKKNDQLIAEEQGRVTVIQQEQANLAAKKEQEVKKTLAETKKIEASIEKSEMTAAYLYTAELLCEINSAYRGGTPLSGTLSKTVRDAIAYIEKNYTEAIQLSDVSSSLGVSESYLSRKFKSEVGTTVHEYLTRERILYASRLLSSGHSVSYTSFECGFADSSHFISVFKKITGFTPSEYKKRIK